MIKLHASFYDDESDVDFEALGIDNKDRPTTYKPVYANPDHITMICVASSTGDTNVGMSDGEIWVVEESPEEVVKKIVGYKNSQ